MPYLGTHYMTHKRWLRWPQYSAKLDSFFFFSMSRIKLHFFNSKRIKFLLKYYRFAFMVFGLKFLHMSLGTLQILQAVYDWRIFEMLDKIETISRRLTCMVVILQDNDIYPEQKQNESQNSFFLKVIEILNTM